MSPARASSTSSRSLAVHADHAADADVLAETRVAQGQAFADGALVDAGEGELAEALLDELERHDDRGAHRDRR